jgi:tryptophan 2,3-dioxygenase
MPRAPTAYWDYIRVEELLTLQRGLEASEATLSNDEVMFITIHQIDELWFKLALRELISVRDLFKQNPVPEQALASVVRGIRRVENVFDHVTGHFTLMETMTTRDYLDFRDKLSPASGFQSAQMREIEILLGLSDTERVPLGHEHSYLAALRNADGTPSTASQRVERRAKDLPSLREVFRDWLARTPIDGSIVGQPDDEARVREFLNGYLESHARATRHARDLARTSALTPADEKRLEDRYEKEIESARAFLFAEDRPAEERVMTMRVRAALVFLESYRELPLLAWPREVMDALCSLEQSFVVFRQRHARMVERIIGRRTGTGGSSGVDYLDQTALRYRIFRDVWAVRTLLVRHAELPALKRPEFYGFAVG